MAPPSPAGVPRGRGVLCALESGGNRRWRGPVDRVATAPSEAGTKAVSEAISISYVPREIYAALDLGTNNCRLLVARRAGRGFRIIDAFSRIVRLGEGLDATGRLSEAAMARTIDALKVCAGKIDQRKVSRGRYGAT